MTPSLLLATTLGLAGVSPLLQWFLVPALLAAYFLFAVNAASDRETD